MEYDLVVYGRLEACPFVRVVRRVLERGNIPYREIYIDQDPAAEQRVIDWTGFKAVPTVILARPGEDVPYEAPAPLEAGSSPRGIDRGSMITEPGQKKFETWLRTYGLLE